MEHITINDFAGDILVERNTFDITSADLSWIYQNLGEPPRRIIGGLLRRRFDSYGKRFRTKRGLAEACFEFARVNRYEFERADVDRELLREFLSLPLTQPDTIISEFRTLWRGFKAEDMAQAKKGLAADKRAALGKIDAVVHRNEIAMITAGRKKQGYKVAAYEANLNTLSGLRARAVDTFANIEDCAYRKCAHATTFRRPSTRLPNVSADDFLLLGFHLPWLDPHRVDFPLRFAVHLLTPLYDRMFDLWKAGKSKEEVIEPLMPLLSSDRSFRRLSESCRRIDLALCSDIPARSSRARVMDEIGLSFKSQCYTAVTLLAVTQVEGILWDFARFLNAQNIRIFKTEYGRGRPIYRPYSWDPAHKTYKYPRSSGTPDCDPEKTLASARALLKETRMGEYFDQKLYDYLIDDFYDERCSLAHGAPAATRETAARALLCLWMVLPSVGRFLDDRQAGRPAR